MEINWPWRCVRPVISFGAADESRHDPRQRPLEDEFLLRKASSERPQLPACRRIALSLNLKNPQLGDRANIRGRIIRIQAMALTIERVEILLLVAAVVAMLARRLRVPYSIGLLLAGIALALLPFAPQIQLTKELIFSAFLPPLIFEAAFQLKWKELQKDLPVILLLATVGVLLSMAITAGCMRFLVGWQWTAALIFGVLIAATDPVSVIATFKEAGAKGRIRLLVEAESLFNDCTSAVLFSIALAIAAGQSVSAAGITVMLIAVVLGAVVCGALVAAAVLLLMGRIDDH